MAAPAIAENESFCWLLVDVTREYDGAFMVYGHIAGPDYGLGIDAQKKEVLL